jgi:hypothetical protein
VPRAQLTWVITMNMCVRWSLSRISFHNARV